MSATKSQQDEILKKYEAEWRSYKTAYELAKKQNMSQCECGVDSAGVGRHSKWCCKSELDNYQESDYESA